MNILLLFRNVFANLRDFIVVGLVTDHRPDVELVEQNPLYARVIPQIARADFGFVAAEVPAVYTLMVVSGRFYTVLI